MPVIQLRLIVGGSRYLPDIASELIAGYKDGWSHVDAIVPAGFPWAKEGWLYGARSDRLAGVPSGVQLRPPGYTTFRRCGILTIPVTQQQLTEFWNAEWVKIGRPYDWRSIVAFAVPFGLTRNWHDPNAWICSEAVEDSLETAKVLSEFYLAPYKISPGMLAARAEVLPGVWFTEIKPGTNPLMEIAIAMKDCQYHTGATWQN